MVTVGVNRKAVSRGKTRWSSTYKNMYVPSSKRDFIPTVSRMYMAGITRRFTTLVYSLWLFISEDGAKTLLGFRFMTNYINGFGSQPVENQVHRKQPLIANQLKPQPWFVRMLVSTQENKYMDVSGRKRFITVDLLGLILRVLITSASVPEVAGAKLNVQSFNFIRWTIKLKDCTLSGWMEDIGGKILPTG